MDNVTNEVIDSTKKLKLANIPKLTNRFSLIIDGNEYQPVNQFRLKPGIYTRQQANGELESRFNLEKGYNFRIILNQDTAIFYLVLANRKYRLYNLLHSLDVSDLILKEVWGDEIFKSNVSKALNTEAQDIIDIHETLTRKRLDYPNSVKGIKNYLKDTKVSPETTKLTLGSSFSSVTPDALIATSKKILDVTKGIQQVDERDSLLFKELYTVDDLLTSYFDGNKDSIVKGIQRRVDLKDSIRSVVSASTYSKPIKTFFTTGDLASTPLQTNPSQILGD